MAPVVGIGLWVVLSTGHRVGLHSGHRDLCFSTRTDRAVPGQATVQHCGVPAPDLHSTRDHLRHLSEHFITFEKHA